MLRSGSLHYCNKTSERLSHEDVIAVAIPGDRLNLTQSHSFFTAARPLSWGRAIISRSSTTPYHMAGAKAAR